MRSSEPSDSELLAAWWREQDEPSFRQLVARYAGLVHMAAMRTTGDATIAAEISQATFILLARKAKSLSARSSLAGWLHVTAVMLAKNLIRKNRREIRKRELLHADMDTNANDGTAAKWKELQPVLDEAIAALPEKDREVLLLYFYRALNFREVGDALGIAGEAARKRIVRATEKLRAKLALRGMDAGGSLSSVMLAGFAADTQMAGLPVSTISMKATAAAAQGASVWVPTTIVMKGMTFVPPIAALIIAGLWIGSRRDAVAKMESGNRALASVIAAGGSGNETVSAGPARKARGMDDGKGGVNWEVVSDSTIERMRLGVWGAVDSMNELELKTILSKMSPDEVLAQLDVIATLPVSDEIKEELQQAILLPMAWKHPELLLERLADRLPGSGMLTHFMTLSLENVAKKDPAQAAKWLDEQIAAGRLASKRLDGVNHTRLSFEAVVVRKFLTTDPEAAGRRIEALAAGQMPGLFGNLANEDLSEEEQAGFLKLVRAHLPAKEQVKAITAAVEPMAQDFGKIEAFMDRAGLDGDARDGAVVAAGARNIKNVACNRNVTKADLDAVRDWVTREAPDQLGRTTGEALAWACDYGVKLGFNDAVALAMNYRELPDSDDILVAFLGSDTAKKNKDKARELAAEIGDEGRRNTVLETLR